MWKRAGISVSGALLFEAVFIAILVLLFLSLTPFPPLAPGILLLISPLALLCGAFVLRLNNRASQKELCLAVFLLYPILNLLLLFMEPAIPAASCLIGTAVFFGISWLIASVGILAARLFGDRCASPRTRHMITGLTTLPFLFIPLGFGLGHVIHYTASDRQAARLGPPALQCMASALSTTRMIPDLQVPVTDGTNLIWCAPFQLAWNEMMDLIGEDIRLAGDEPACVDRLNQGAMTGAFLDEDTYLALGGKYTAAFVDEVNRRVNDAFGHGAFDPAESPPDDAPRLAAYSCLSVNLPFKHAFQRSGSPMTFNGTSVESFTIPYEDGAGKRAERAKRQVVVMYPPEERSFVVELITRKRDHHLILAQIAPEATLAKTVEKTCRYVDTLERKALNPNQELEVPLFNFDITRSYSEFTGKPLQVNTPDYAGWQIEEARQKIRFQLDERGAVLRSDAFLFCVLCVPPADCIFDEPFLLMLRYRDNAWPYFVLWVDNAEILVPSSP